MGNPLISREIDAAVSAVLLRALERSGGSLRALSRQSGVKLTRLGDVLKRGKAMTLGELVLIAPPLRLIPWRVMREAEEAVAGETAPAGLVVVDGGGDKSTSETVTPERNTQAPRVFEQYGRTPPARGADVAANEGDVEAEQEERL